MDDKDWDLSYRGNSKVAKTVKARICGRRFPTPPGPAPSGIQFHSTITTAHQPGRRPDPASNPCSNTWLDDRRGNLASLNLMQFRKDVDGGAKIFYTAAFEHGCRLWTIVLEISV